MMVSRQLGMHTFRLCQVSLFLQIMVMCLMPRGTMWSSLHYASHVQ